MLDDVWATWSRWEIIWPAVLGIALVPLWGIPGIKLLFYPFQLLNTFIHELCHGFTALLTGRPFKFMIINRNREGAAYMSGGHSAPVVMAGYLGSVVVSGLFIYLPTVQMPATLALIWFGITFLVLCVAFVRNLYGLISGIVIAVALVGAGRVLDDAGARILLGLFAVQMPLAALRSLWVLIRLSFRPPRPDSLNDAQVMHKLTGVPALIWSILWLGISVAFLLAIVTAIYRYR